MSTAEVINNSRETDIVACPEIREVNYGQAEGLTFQEISRLYPELAKMIANFDQRMAFPGGEAFADFVERTISFLKRLDKHDPEETILIVSHSGPLRVLVCHLIGLDQSCWWRLRFDNCSLSILDTYPEGCILTRLNDTSFLKEPG